MFSSTATNAQSVTSVSPVGGVHLKVTHTFLPSSTSNLYEVQVKIENIGDAAATDVQYVRVMDWDVEPTPFSEFVEIGGLPASNLVLSHDNGFSSSDPTTGSSALDIDSLNANYFGGPFDHGAYFLFSFGALAPEGVAEFSIFYGAANSRREALAALGLVGAEVYSLGTPDRDPSSSDFSVAIFGFKGVGGDPLPTVPEPSSLLLCGLGMMGVLAHRRKK